MHERSGRSGHGRAREAGGVRHRDVLGVVLEERDQSPPSSPSSPKLGCPWRAHRRKPTPTRRVHTGDRPAAADATRQSPPRKSGAAAHWRRRRGRRRPFGHGRARELQVARVGEQRAGRTSSGARSARAERRQSRSHAPRRRGFRWRADEASVDASTNDATRGPRRRSRESTPVRLTKPAPRTVSAVPPTPAPTPRSPRSPSRCGT